MNDNKQKVFFDMGMSLDGFIAPEGMTVEHADNPEYKQWQQLWGGLQGWMFPLKFIRENLKFGSDGETGRDNQLVEEAFKRTGASIMGKNMFDLGEAMWPEEAPFHTAVFVLTREEREPWERPGGTTFYFVTSGIESALKQARKAAGAKDIRIAGGADTVRQYLRAGYVDEFTIHHSPVFFGSGVRLFDDLSPEIKVRIKESSPSKLTTHVTYVVET